MEITLNNTARWLSWSALLALAWSSGCASAPDRAALIDDLRALHAAQVQAHLDGDAEFFGRDLSEDLFSVWGGEIRRPKQEDVRAMFERYLGRTTFSRYEDLEEPLVGVSDDGSLGWIAVRMRIEGVEVLEDGEPAPMGFTCAWLTLYRRDGERWIRLGDATTYE